MLKVESYKKGIVLSTVFNVFNKGLVFANGLVVAYFFGVHQGTDLFFYVYNSVLILGVFFSSMNGSVIIPESMRIRVQEGEMKAMQFLNFFIALYALLMFAGILIILLSNPVSFFSVISNFARGDLDAHQSILFLALPLFGIISVTTLLIDILASYKFFTISMIVGIVNGIFSIACVFALHNQAGINSVFYGLIASYICNLLMLLYLMKRFLHWKFSFRWQHISKRIWKNIGFAQLGNLASTLSSYMPMYILSGFSAGIITALTFAQQIASLPNSLIINQFSSVAGIKFNELYARKDYPEINKVFVEATNFLLFLMFPIGFFLYFFSAEIVHILLGFTSLTESSSGYVALFLKYLGFLLPLYVINSLISRLFMASHKIKESFWYQVLFNILLIGGLYYSVNHFGIVGYPLAMVVAYTINVIACYYIEKYYFNVISYKDIFINMGSLFFINGLIGTAVFILARNVGIQNVFLKVVTAFGIYAICLLIANNVFKLNTVLFLQTNILREKLKKKV